MTEEKQTSRRSFLRKSIIAAAGLVTGAKAVKMLADYTPQPGKLNITNYAYSGDFNLTVPHYTLHWTGGEEGYGGFDHEYRGPPFWDTPIMTKIISRVEEKELKTDTRPIDSLSAINLELSLHSESGGPIDIPADIKNELGCRFMGGYTFGRKPICLYRVNDDGLEFLADIREAIAKSPDRIARIPLPDLKGTYESQIPYAKFQIVFRFPGDINMNKRVDAEDLEILSNEWLSERDPNDPNSCSPISDISGPNDIPDGKVNELDFAKFARDYGKDANDPNTW